MRNTVSLAAILAFAPIALAQTSTGTIVGAITDRSRSAVANARVVVINAGTSAKREVVSNDEGGFTAPLLPPGRYTVSVFANGFKEFEQSGVVVQIQQQA